MRRPGSSPPRINIVPVFDYTAGVSDGDKVCGRGSNQTKTVTVIDML